MYEDIHHVIFLTKSALCSSVLSEHTGFPFLVCDSNASAEAGHSLISELLVSFQSTEFVVEGQ